VKPLWKSGSPFSKVFSPATLDAHATLFVCNEQGSLTMGRDEEIAIEWDCQKLLRQYYHYVDKKEHEKAAELFTPDVEWSSMGVVLKGHDDILKDLHGSLGDGTIRHVFTNAVVEVIDENHAVSRSYNTNYYTRGIRIEDCDESIPFAGPHRLSGNDAELVRTEDGWKISRRAMSHVFRHNPDERVGLEIWGESAGKMEKTETVSVMAAPLR